MFQTFRSAAKRLPFIRRLVAQRQQFQEALWRMTAERDALRGASPAPPVALPSHHAVQPGDAAAERDAFRQELAALRIACGFVPPGHYYSPIPPFDEIRRDEARIFGSVSRAIAGIDLHEDEQLALLEQFAKLYPSIPFRDQATPGLRYHYDNQSYAYSDGVMLHCMLRHLKPKRLIEVGSGFSSCVTLDTNDLFLDGSMQTTFIEPYPELLMSLTSDADRARIRIIPKRLQDVDLDVFASLQSGDVLFIDSTHVSRIDSDVNRVFFDILPSLAPGVLVHFHDIFYPFEYPKEWVRFGRAWNEMYLLRAFLQYNTTFRVVLMNTYLAHFHRPFFEERMPLVLKNTGGSIWLCKEGARGG